MAGKKRILIFSDAGGTGRSYHADLNAKNQQKRIHYLLQPGWRADKAVQGLGRTHRTNQAQPPHYVLVTTNLKAQRRFLSSIARRLDQLGALTKGQRDTANQGLFNAEMNLENEYAEGALATFIQDLHEGRIEDLSVPSIEQEMGLRIRDNHGNLRQDFEITVPQFLNRLLSLTTDRMDQVFDNFFDRVKANVEYAREQNMLDTGMETVKADHIKKVEDLVVRDGKDNLGETHYVKLELTHPAILIPFDQLPLEAEFAHNNRSKALYAFTPSTHVTNPKTGNIIARRRRIGVTGADYITLDEYQNKYTPVKAMSPEQIRAQWDKALDEAPKTRTQTMHMVTGALLPIWDRLPQDKAKIFRAQTDEGERILGREIGAKQVGSVLKALGVARDVPTHTPAEWLKRVLIDGDTLMLANGWKIERRKVSNENRIELTGPSYPDYGLLKEMGAFTEIINYKTRVFIPSQGAEILERILKSKPLIEVIEKEEEDSPRFSRGGRGPGVSAEALSAHTAKLIGPGKPPAG